MAKQTIEFSNIDCNSFLKELKKNIDFPYENTFANHFKTVFNRRFNCGLVNDNGFIFWDYNFMIGAFYPIINGFCKIKENKVAITIKMNLLGKLIYFFIIFAFGFSIFPSIFFNGNASYFNKFLLLFILCSLLYLAIRLGYNYQKKKIITVLKNTINNHSLIGE